MLKELDINALADEEKILNDLFKTADNFESAVFEAGAGSGKTYALVECVKHIISSKFNTLSANNQKIACITFTNVAADNIRSRVGSSTVLEVSTIHERIWEMIKNQQPLLVGLHSDKLKKELEKIDKDIANDPVFSNYKALSAEHKEKFLQIMLNNKDIYKGVYNQKAGPFKEAINRIDGMSDFENLIKNVDKFKKIVKALYDRESYKECLIKIENGKNAHLVYDSKYNRDRLDKMSISHDTVLEYGFSAIEKNSLLKKMIIDKYPYILIDEYQDTNPNVVNIMEMLDSYGKEINHNIYIAYFGDYAQNIYDTGTGEGLKIIHRNIKTVSKIYNRRSCCEIIDVINKIRNDNSLVQYSIYKDSYQGKVKFFQGNDIDNFLKECKKDLCISQNNKLNCLVLRNKDIAYRCHFDNFYDAFYKSDCYAGSKRDLLNSELLSNDIAKLGEIPLLLYKIMKLLHDVKEDTTPLKTITQLSSCRAINVNDLETLIKKIRYIKGFTIEEILQSIFEIYSTDDKNIKILIQDIFGLDGNLSFGIAKQHFAEKLFKNDVDKVETLLQVSFDELESWYKYVITDTNEDVVFHTIHGSKGEEYANVAVVIGDSFGKNKRYFRNFFENYNSPIKEKEYISARNLLYVACSRAIYNLYILYTDDLKGIECTVENIFGEITYLQ